MSVCLTSAIFGVLAAVPVKPSCWPMGARTLDLWWQASASKLAGQKNLRVYALAPEESQALAGLAARNMRLQCTIQDGVIWLGSDSAQVELKPRLLFGPEQ